MADESLCRRCGRCCYEKIVIDGTVVSTDIPCKYLDEETMLCTVYERRHDKQIRCLTIEDGIEYGAFPDDCPYVAGIVGYEGPVAFDCAIERLGVSVETLRALLRDDE